MKKNKRQYLPLALAAGIFLLGGFDGLQQGALLVGVANLVAGVVNLAALKLVERRPRLTSIVVNLMNATVAGVMSVSAVLAGKSYIQYAWALACLFFLGYVFRLSRRRAASVDAA